MRYLAILLASFALAPPADAQSNMLLGVVNDMRSKGVPEECIRKVTSNDAAKITTWSNSGRMSKADARRRTNALIEQICAR